MKSVFQFVSTNYLSGLENVVLNISILLRNKYNFVYISPRGPIDYYLKKYNIQHIIVNKLTPLSVREIIKKYHPNIVHGHDVKASLYLAINSHLCHKHGIKIISELHNDDPRMHKLSLRSLLYNLSTYDYDRIIVVYKSILTNYIFKKNIVDKAYIINNVVNPLRIPQYKSFPKKWNCIFIGRFVDQKNPIKFVKIIYELKKLNKKVSAVMLGTGPLFPVIKKLINYYSLNKNVQLQGFCRNPYKYLYKSQVLIMPSKYEGLSLTAIESLLCGIPIIASRIDGFMNIINNKCGYMTNNIFECVHIIHNIINNPYIYETKSKYALKRGYYINKVTSFVSSYDNIYRNLI